MFALNSLDYEKPHLLLNFDVNGTIILNDSTKNVSDEHMIINAIAESTIGKWDTRSEPMPFNQYVDNVLLPGDKSNAKLKKERQKVIGGFLKWLADHAHPMQNTVLIEFDEMKKKLALIKQDKADQDVFPSFYVMLEKLRQMNIPFTIILRTFGTDLQKVVQEIEEHPLGLKFSNSAKFHGGNFTLNGKKTIKKVDEVFNLFLNSNEHFAVQDEWSTWNQDGERSRSGKPFIYDITRKAKIKNLSLFFDDNITGKEMDIVRPCEISNNNFLTGDLLNKLLFPVNTKEALLNENYFIEKIIQTLQANS